MCEGIEFGNHCKIAVSKRLHPLVHNGLRYEHVAGFGVLLYQNTPKLDAGMKVT
jgi:hypothetical protein